MKKLLRKGLVVLTIYAVTVICTFLVTNRVQELEGSNNFRNTNTSLSINLSK